MPALLVVLLLAATVDPRLTEPLRLLAEIGTSDTRTLGTFYGGVPDALSLRLVVRPLSDGEDARYDRAPRRVTIAESLIAEDPRLVAVVLVHELRHATDLEWVSQGAVALDCLELEARGFEAEATVARAFWPDALPDATDRERDLTAIVEGYEAGGADGLRDMVRRDGDYAAGMNDSAGAD